MPPEARGAAPVLYTTKIDLYYYGDLLQQLVFWAAGDAGWDWVLLPWTPPNRQRFLAGYGDEPAAARLAQLSIDCAADDPDLRPTARQALARLTPLSSSLGVQRGLPTRPIQRKDR